MGPGDDKLHALVDKRFGRISEDGGKIPTGKKSTHGLTTGRKYHYGISIRRYDATDRGALLTGQLGERLKELLHLTLYHVINVRLFLKITAFRDGFPLSIGIICSIQYYKNFISMQRELSKSTEAPDRPQEETLSVIGHDITVKLGADQTDGMYSVFELIVPPDTGTGLHIDKDWDEYWHVMEGKFAFSLNGERKELSAGSFAVGSRGIPHSFRNVGDTVGKLVMMTVPSGLEAFFRHVHQASLKGRPDKEEFVAIMRAYHIDPA